MKIALVIQRFSPVGGAERACANLARGLVDRGHEVHVFAQYIKPIPGITPRVVPSDGMFDHQSFANQSRKMLEKESFQIIHSFTRTAYQDILRLGGGIHKEYLAQTERAYSTLGRWWRKIRPKERYELGLEYASFNPAASKAIVAVSKRVKEEAVRHYNVPAAKIEVIHNGVDGNDFKPSEEARGQVRQQLGLAEGDYTLLFVGTGFRRKGLDYAIQAVDRVPHARLIVVGEGKVRPHPRVMALGRRSDVPYLYAAADAFIFPTLYDPFPNATLEAMATGIPVIVSRIAGTSELIDGDSIVIEEPWNIDELTAAVKLLEDPAIRKPMGEAARRKALTRPIEKVVDENLALYDKIRRLKSGG